MSVHEIPLESGLSESFENKLVKKSSDVNACMRDIKSENLSSGGSRGVVKKEEITERRKAGRASKTKSAFPLAEGLDQPLQSLPSKVAQFHKVQQISSPTSWVSS